MIRTLAQCMSFIYTIKSKSLEGRGYYENIIELQWNQCSSTGYKLLLEICVLTLFYPNFIIHLSIGITNWSYVYKATLQYVRYTFSYLRSSRYFKVLVPNLPWRSFMAWNFFFIIGIFKNLLLHEKSNLLFLIYTTGHNFILVY